MSQSFHSLKISGKINETSDSASFLFEIPEELKEAYSFQAGQYLTVKVQINGEELRRSYSIFTAPGEDDFGFTVKRLKGGKVSNYLIDNFSEGDSMELMTPEGNFTLTANPAAQRDHYFISGGSGITPVMSMIQTVLEEEPMSKAFLIYCNRNEDSIIFKNKLQKLENKYAGQFILRHVLSQPSTEKASGIKGIFGKKVSSWDGWTGRIDAGKLQLFFDENESHSGEDHYYMCGPEGLIQTTENYLSNKGISSDRMHKEYFTTADVSEEQKEQNISSSEACTAEVSLNGENFTVEIPSDKTVLEALLDMGKDAPYSCTSGACSTCVAKVSEGEVEMDVCFALDEKEVADGYILTCQSRAKSSNLKLKFEG